MNNFLDFPGEEFLQEKIVNQQAILTAEEDEELRREKAESDVDYEEPRERTDKEDHEWMFYF